MDCESVPQQDNKTLGGHRKTLYARDAQGRVVPVESSGWEVEEIVTLRAVDDLRAQAEQARQRVAAGLAAPLEYWIYARRMDVALLAQTSGLWRWRVRRHLQPARFARLPARILARYAAALGLPVEQLRRLP